MNVCIRRYAMIVVIVQTLLEASNALVMPDIKVISVKKTLMNVIRMKHVLMAVLVQIRLVLTYAFVPQIGQD